MFEDDWAVIGKIIVKAYLDLEYFPTILAVAFVHYCLFGKVDQETMLESFKMYLSSSERELIDKALQSDTDDGFFLSDEFMEFLEQFKCRSRVTKASVVTIIFEIAQQELIQRPHIMASTWQKAFAPLKKIEVFNSPISISAMIYERTFPTAKKVLSLLEYDCHYDNDRECIGYLKRYIKGLDQSMLKKFLKFFTGCDVIIVKEIPVAFVIDGSEFSRRPVAHTCGPLLELPSTYRNFPELRSEFTNILKSSDWEMDII